MNIKDFSNKEVEYFKKRLRSDFPHYKGIDSNGDVFLQGGDEDNAEEMLCGLVKIVIKHSNQHIIEVANKLPVHESRADLISLQDLIDYLKSGK